MRALAALLTAALATPAPAAGDSGADAADSDSVCTLIAESAERHALPPAFFARLIWKESRFDAKALSPVGAQGIAQFMPRTAAERGLDDPWDPAQAIPASAHLLADLRGDFGNLGLAAAAYNAGPDRVSGWLSRGRGLPWETVDYVHSVTGRPASWFRDPTREAPARPLHPEKSFDAACRALPVIATRAMPRPPWGVQIASAVNRGAAHAAFRRIKQRYPAALRGTRPLVLRSGMRTGARYVARIGAPSRRAAGHLCARLRRAGGTCVVLRN